EAISPGPAINEPSPTPYFKVEELAFLHQEDDFSDFSREPLMPHMLSREGPKPAVGDVNGDGWDDMYMPGAAGQPGQLFLQNRNREFRPSQTNLWAGYARSEEIEALFFDADGDQDADLYIVCGQTRAGVGQPEHQDRLLLNDGKGRFEAVTGHLPRLRQGGSCVDYADIDADGDLDLVVGARSVPGAYGLSPQSSLLINDGKGYFSDETKALMPDFERIGLVSDVAWVDLDNDVQVELVVVGEWMPITIFKRNEAGKWEQKSYPGLEDSEGWWNSVLAADLDGDGDEDLVGGNLGLNSTFKASVDEPCTLYTSDFDLNGTVDPIICYYREGISYPMAHRDELLGQVISLRRRYPGYQDFAGQQITDLFDEAQLGRAIQRKVSTFTSQVFWNDREAGFRPEALPRAAQVAPIYGLLHLDATISRQPGLYLAGNFYGVGPGRGRYDASRGLLLQYVSGQWETVPAAS
ncbi:MAG: VCBS repeat-containing protein, partial [Bacteroidota bacterium]